MNGPGYPVLFRPYTSQENYVLIYKELECRPCTRKNCDHISCIENIAADEVIEASKVLLNLLD